MYKLFLTTTIGGISATIEATDMLMNWDDVTLSYKRDGLGAVMRAFSTQFEFAKEARDMLLAAFLVDGVRADASVGFQTRNEDYTYTTLFTCALDFSTLTYDAHRASINAVDSSIASKLKAARSQKYQYAVSGLTTQAATYHHLPMLNNVQWFFNEWYDRIYDKEIAYLESTGTQYIDTGIVPDASTGIWIDVESSDNTNAFIVGLRDTTGNTRWCIGHQSSGYYGGYGTSISTAGDRITAMRMQGKLNYEADGLMTATDGVTTKTYTLPTLSFVPSNNIRLFGSAGVSGSYTIWSGRIYAVKITQGNDVIMDMIPVRVATEGCMYDKVSGKIFRNDGTGDFLLGADVSEPSEELYGSFFTKNGQPMATQIPLAVKGSEIAVRGTSTFVDVDRHHYTTSDLETKLEPIFTAGVDCTVTLALTLDTHAVMYGTNNVTLWSLIIGKVETGEDDAKTLTALDTVDMINTRNVSLTNSYALAAGDQLVVYYLAAGSKDDRVYFIIDDSSLSVTYIAQDYIPEQIDAMQPVTLMQALLDSICGVGNVTGAISTSDDRLQHTWLMAAESIRGLSDAQIYTSWGDFCGFMDAQFGYVPEIDEALQTVTFKERRGSVFDVTLSTVHTFMGDEAQDVEVSVAEELLASKVSVGYEKQEYDSVNGRDEWRWTAEYATGITNSDNEVSLECKYRADAYGIEFLTMTRTEQTTDKEADEDIFLADLDTINGVFTFRIDVPVTGIIAVNAMPNGRYTQKYMAQANAFLLARLTQTLSFTSIQGNQSAVVGGTDVTADVSLAGWAHMQPYKVTFTTQLQTVFDWTRRLAVVSGGHTYTGWAQDVRFGVGRDTRVQYTLLINSIS